MALAEDVFAEQPFLFFYKFAEFGVARGRAVEEGVPAASPYSESRLGHSVDDLAVLNIIANLFRIPIFAKALDYVFQSVGSETVVDGLRPFEVLLANLYQHPYTLVVERNIIKALGVRIAAGRQTDEILWIDAFHSLSCFCQLGFPLLATFARIAVAFSEAFAASTTPLP